MSLRESGGCDAGEGEYTTNLHVIVIFVVLLASFLGTLIPIIGKYVPALRMPPFVFILGKCIAAGVLLSVATIHMINESVAQLNEDCVPESFRKSYGAYAFLFAVCGALLMHVTDILVDIYVDGADTGDEVGVEDVESAAVLVADTVDQYGGHQCHHTAKKPVSRVRRFLSAMFMEFAVTVHSVFIGLAIGIAKDAEAKVLLVALVFHQMFEGLALGARLVDASMSLKLEMMFALIFSVSAPLGTAIAVITIVVGGVPMTGAGFVITQAVVSAVCGGILLYLAFGLMLSDFPSDLRKHAATGEPRCYLKRFGMFFALWFGAGLMAFIGKWI